MVWLKGTPTIPFQNAPGRIANGALVTVSVADADELAPPLEEQVSV
jgi:hypothetical protein